MIELVIDRLGLQECLTLVIGRRHSQQCITGLLIGVGGLTEPFSQETRHGAGIGFVLQLHIATGQFAHRSGSAFEAIADGKHIKIFVRRRLKVLLLEEQTGLLKLLNNHGITVKLRAGNRLSQVFFERIRNGIRPAARLRRPAATRVVLGHRIELRHGLCQKLNTLRRLGLIADQGAPIILIERPQQELALGHGA